MKGISKTSIRGLLISIGLASSGLITAAARADNVYVSFDSNNDTIEKFDSGAGNADLGAFATSDLATANGIAFDSHGNLYVANSGGNSITKFDPQGNATRFASGLNAPAGLAFDGYGNLYVANNGDSTIVKITPDGTASVFASAGLSKPTGLAFDQSGNLYVANSGGSTIEKIDADGNPTLFASPDAGYTTLNTPMGLAFDATGNLYVANFMGNNIEEFSADGTALGSFASEGLDNPHGLAFDSSGNLFVANYHHTGDEGSGYSTIEEFTSTGTLVNTFHDRNGNLRDASFVAVTNSAGVPLPLVQPIPEPRARAFLALGAVSFVFLTVDLRPFLKKLLRLPIPF